MAGYQHRDPRRDGVAALERKLTEARRRALRAERELKDSQTGLLDAQLRAREADNDRHVYDRRIRQLHEERDHWRREADRLSPESLPVVNDLTAEDKLITRCRCGAWKYDAPLCSGCMRRPGA